MGQTQPNKHKPDGLMWDFLRRKGGLKKKGVSLSLHHHYYKQLEAHADVQALPNRRSSPHAADSRAEAEDRRSLSR